MLKQVEPDLLIAIDVGQTCTGVAYSAPNQGSDHVRWVQKWPGRANANENKVPTVLAYPVGHDRPTSWGFRAELSADHDNIVIREWFKTLLDQRHLERQNDRDASQTTHEEVRHWFRDYLSLLYEHLKLRLSAELPNFDWDSSVIEFLFSVPTTWSPQVVETFREIIGQSGFGGPLNTNHTVTISLTEPEAAAVHTSTAAAGIFENNDVLVVCDAGGGTTDISVLQVTDTLVDALSLKQLKQIQPVGGRNIGSAGIDVAFEKLIVSKLQNSDREALLADPSDIAWEMVKSQEFQNNKCEHGSPDDTPTFSLRVPQLKQGVSLLEARVQDGQMLFDHREMRMVFDQQIDKLFDLIDEQLRTLADRLPQRSVDHLVLAGGLGQSPYVQRRLREYYGDGAHRYENAKSMQIRIAPDPQLAVCKGMVADRLRKLKFGRSVLGWRCCRASYGLVCKEIYDKKNPKHVGRQVQRDPRDREWYVLESIDWFVEKGSPVSVEQPIVHRFHRKLAPGDPRKVFPTTLVVSYLDKDSLPSHLNPGASGVLAKAFDAAIANSVGAGVEKLCEVESDLSDVDERLFIEKNKEFWKLGEHYLSVCYEVKVIIGAADLLFELWFNGQKMSKDHSIKVEWAPSTAPSTAVLQPPPTSALIEEDGVLRSKRPNFRLPRIRSHHSSLVVSSTGPPQ